MTMYTILIFFVVFTITFVTGDFFSDLDKLDIDSKLSEIDKAINSINRGDGDSVVNNIQAKSRGKVREDDDDPTLGNAVEILADLFGGECKYQCKNGNKPTGKTEHVPTSNGCGSSGIKIDTDDVPGMEDCCHKHDFCYDTCNSDRATCDKKFKECLHKTCKKLKDSNKKKISNKDCKGTADLMYSGTVALGCDAFLKAQESACSCSKSNKTKTSSKSENIRDTSKRDQKDRKSSGRHSDEL